VLIIIEGADCTGKSTLVRAVETELRSWRTHPSITVRHAKPPRSHPLDEYETPLLNYKPGTNHHIVCDRWHLGEAVYPDVLGRPTRWDTAVARHIDLFLQMKGALVVTVDITERALRRRFENRGDDMIGWDGIAFAHRLYRKALSESVVPSLTVPMNWTQRDVDQIITRAHELETRVRPLVGFTTYVGCRTPHVLLLGDTRNERTQGQPTRSDVPAFGPYLSTSGHYLLSHLQSIRGVGLANACDVDDWQVLRATLGGPMLVTLGANAHRAVAGARKTGPRHGVVPHPQYVRRFFHHSGGAYAEVIQQAMSDRGDYSKWRP